MAKGYILVEGINLYAHIYDTDQLSVIRGSSFLYKEAIETLASDYKGRMEAVSTGASSGLFVTDLPAEEVQGLKRAIVEQLNTHSYYRHLTFAVETCTADNVLQAQGKLARQLRFNQLAGISMAPDRFDPNKHSRMAQADQLEGTRIAATGTKRKVQIREGDDARRLSLSVYERLLHGRKLKQPDQNQDFQYALDINQLCELPEQAKQTFPASYKLNNKMAVIYADGNQFGKLRNGYIRKQIDKGGDGVSALRSFDEEIQGQREKFRTGVDQWLRQLDNQLARIDPFDTDDGTATTKPALRIETLLWGGDEMLFVVPAWLGIAFLQHFFAETRKWQLEGSTKPLTHAAGIVFCQAKTPIRIVRDLAQGLADRAKEKYSRDFNSWDYMILESIDYPAEQSIDNFLCQRYDEHHTSRPSALLVPQETAETNRQMEALLGAEGLPPRQLYQIIDAFEPGVAASLDWEELGQLSALTTEQEQKLTQQEQAERRLLQVVDDALRENLIENLPKLAKQLFNVQLEPDTAQRVWLWLHLLELRDYWRPVFEVALSEGRKTK